VSAPGPHRFTSTTRSAQQNIVSFAANGNSQEQASKATVYCGFHHNVNTERKNV
jgi:hypothetical protein